MKYLDTTYKTKKELKQNIGNKLSIAESFYYDEAKEFFHGKGDDIE